PRSLTRCRTSCSSAAAISGAEAPADSAAVAHWSAWASCVTRSPPYCRPPPPSKSSRISSTTVIACSRDLASHDPAARTPDRSHDRKLAHETRPHEVGAPSDRDLAAVLKTDRLRRRCRHHGDSRRQIKVQVAVQQEGGAQQPQR